MTTAEGPAQRGRGRPRVGRTTETLTRESIARAALDLVADRGFPSLTMRSLAERLGITVRPLYDHVRGRQDVVDLVAARILALQPDRCLDPHDWRAGVRQVYTQGRAAYRVLGRALLLPLDETVSAIDPPLRRVLQPERLLAFLTAIGLSLEEALSWRAQLLTDLFGFALLIDHRFDRADTAEREAMTHPVPRPWLDAHPEADAPLSRRASALPPTDGDAVFEAYIDRAILVIDARRHERGIDDGPRDQAVPDRASGEAPSGIVSRKAP